MPEDLMRYDQLTQNALRGVVRDALRIAEKSGLPGEHHFYIAFNTRHPGVILSDKLLQRYPREMTIVVQHQFSNLIVLEDYFELVLFFDQTPERLVVPFLALTGFLDPSVQVGFQFEVVRKGAKLQLQTEEMSQSNDKDEPVSDKPEAIPEIESIDEEEAEKKIVSLDAFRKK